MGARGGFRFSGGFRKAIESSTATLKQLFYTLARGFGKSVKILKYFA
jgi:hypothetical protein